FPRVARSCILVNDQDTGCAPIPRLLELVFPPTTVCHGFLLTSDRGFSVEVGLVDQDDEHLSLDIDIFEIIPAGFRGMNPISHEYHLRVIEEELCAAQGGHVDHVLPVV